MDLAACFRWIEAERPRMLDDLRALSAVNSGTRNLEGLEKVGALLLPMLGALEGETELIDSVPSRSVGLDGETATQRHGRIISCRKRPEAPAQVLLAGHTDTVFPADHPFQSPVDAGGGRLAGPGVADMKGGIVVMLAALAAFEREQNSDALGWRVLLNADEETGSHGSAAALAEAAAGAHAGLVYEPALADGTLAGARKGSGNFTLVARGRAAHAGREFERGINALEALAAAVPRLAALSRPEAGVTVNVAQARAGTAVNVVPELAVCRFNARCWRREEQARLAESLDGLVARLNAAGGARFALHGGFTRPPKPVTPAARMLMDWTAECGSALGQPVAFADTGGCCDGNNLAAAGLPNVDTLGVLGGGIHTDREFMLIDSLAARAKLSAALLDRLAREGGRLAEAAGERGAPAC